MEAQKIIWIRHGEKLFDNEKGPIGCRQHDPGLIINNKIIENVKYLVDNMSKNYGTPSKIICSPFLRTRQTLNLMRDYLPSNIEIEYSNHIFEYLGYCKKFVYADLEDETQKLIGKTIYTSVESIEDLKSRIQKHLEYVKNTKGVIWVITHGLIMSQIFNILSGKFLERPNPLDSLVLTNKELISVKLK